MKNDAEEKKTPSGDNARREISRTATLGMFPPTRWPFVKRPKPPRPTKPKRQPK